jgi:hypothetical protein
MCKKAKGLHNRIDPCMKRFILFLNFYLEPMNVKTVACCCGHGKYPMTILVKGKEYKPLHIKNPFKKEEPEFIQEVFSGLIIPRTRKFYKKDSKGFYYIPEVINGNKI